MLQPGLEQEVTLEGGDSVLLIACPASLLYRPARLPLPLRFKTFTCSCRSLFLSLKWLLNAHFRQKSACSLCIFHPFHPSPVLLCSTGWFLLCAVVLESVLQKQERTGFCLPESFRLGGTQSFSLKKLTHFKGESGAKRCDTYT